MHRLDPPSPVWKHMWRNPYIRKKRQKKSIFFYYGTIFKRKTNLAEIFSKKRSGIIQKKMQSHLPIHWRFVSYILYIVQYSFSFVPHLLHSKIGAWVYFLWLFFLCKVVLNLGQPRKNCPGSLVVIRWSYIWPSTYSTIYSKIICFFQLGY